MLELILHSHNANWRAVDAVVTMLGSSAAALFRVTYLADRWHHETMSSARDAATRIAELCAPGG
jgi:hypothetical protein